MADDKPIQRVRFTAQIQIGKETTTHIHCKSHKAKASLTDIGVKFVFDASPGEWTVPYSSITCIER